MKTVTVLLALGCLLLAGCASTLIYRPAPTPNDYGYRQQALTDTRFRVSFAGGYGVASETVHNLALFRAAQVALSHGARHFRIISSHTETLVSHSGPVTTVGYGFGDLFWNSGIFISRGYTEHRYQTVLEIKIGPGLPSAGPNIYNAVEVKRHLAALANSARN